MDHPSATADHPVDREHASARGKRSGLRRPPAAGCSADVPRPSARGAFPVFRPGRHRRKRAQSGLREDLGGTGGWQPASRLHPSLPPEQLRAARAVAARPAFGRLSPGDAGPARRLPRPENPFAGSAGALARFASGLERVPAQGPGQSGAPRPPAGRAVSGLAAGQPPHPAAARTAAGGGRRPAAGRSALRAPGGHGRVRARPGGIAGALPRGAGLSALGSLARRDRGAARLARRHQPVPAGTLCRRR